MPAISYLSPAWTNTFLAPSSVSAAANQLAVASLRSTSTNKDFVPTFQNATSALGTIVPPGPLVARNPTSWIPNSSNPSTDYAISGTSQIIVSQCYANHGNTPSVAASVVDFLTQHYSASNSTQLHGYGFDSVPSSFQTAITHDFFTFAPSGNLHLGIGDPTACGAIAGR